MATVKRCEFCTEQQKIEANENGSTISLKDYKLNYNLKYQEYAGGSYEEIDETFNINNCPMCGEKLLKKN